MSQKRGERGRKVTPRKNSHANAEVRFHSRQDPAQAKVTGIQKSNLQMKRPSCQSERYEQCQKENYRERSVWGEGKGVFSELEKFELEWTLEDTELETLLNDRACI